MNGLRATYKKEFVNGAAADDTQIKLRLR